MRADASPTRALRGADRANRGGLPAQRKNQRSRLPLGRSCHRSSRGTIGALGTCPAADRSSSRRTASQPSCNAPPTVSSTASASARLVLWARQAQLRTHPGRPPCRLPSEALPRGSCSGTGPGRDFNSTFWDYAANQFEMSRLEPQLARDDIVRGRRFTGEIVAQLRAIEAQGFLGLLNRAVSLAQSRLHVLPVHHRDHFLAHHRYVHG